MASKQIKQQVEAAFVSGRGHTQEKLETLSAELGALAEDDEEDEAHRLAAGMDQEYVDGVLETPGPFLTDLAYINRKRRQ
jgi:hypothetical protein